MDVGGDLGLDRWSVLNILFAMELAYGVEDDVEAWIREFCTDDSVVHGDEQYIRRMAALMREHWEQQRGNVAVELVCGREACPWGMPFLMEFSDNAHFL